MVDLLTAGKQPLMEANGTISLCVCVFVLLRSFGAILQRKAAISLRVFLLKKKSSSITHSDKQGKGGTKRTEKEKLTLPPT